MDNQSKFLSKEDRDYVDKFIDRLSKGEIKRPTSENCLSQEEVDMLINAMDDTGDEDFSEIGGGN
jgi:hypothetical protein